MIQFELDYRLATRLRFWDACGNKPVADPSVHVRLTDLLRRTLRCIARMF
jgi:hypothetical protein